MGNHESSQVPRGGCVVAIEGNIGAGKTTRCKLLQERLGGPEKVVVLTEEILDHWLLEAFYREPSRYAYSLHQETIKMNKKAMETAEAMAYAGKIVIMDRCLLGVWVFINANMGHMGPVLSVEIRNQFAKALAEAPKPNLVVHLRTEPGQCLKNIKERGRHCESAITLDYLKQLDQYHYDILYGSEVPAKVVPLDFGPIPDELVAAIHACRPYLLPPVKYQNAGGDSEDSDPLADGGPLAEEDPDQGSCDV